MTAETIIRVIRAEAEAEATQIVAKARQRADDLVEAAAEEARRRIEQTLARVGPELDAEHVRAVNAARLRLIERRTELVASETAAVFDAAEDRLARIAAGADPDRWATALRRLSADAVSLLGAGTVIEAPASAARSLEHELSRAGARLYAINGPDPPRGVRARSADGRIEIDATIDARLARARTRLADEVAAALGLPS